MNIKKIEADFLKGLFSKESNKYCIIEYGGGVGYSDGFYIALVHKDMAFVKCSRPPIKGERVIGDLFYKFDKCISNYSNTIPAKYKNLARYEREDGRGYAYIDVKYTKYFDKDASYYVKDCKSPVHVYENDHFVGLIMPVSIKEDVI